MDGADVWIVQRGRRTRLSVEPAERVRIPRDCLGEKLERDEPVQANVLGLVHHTHPATADSSDDAVVGDRLTGEGTGTLCGVIVRRERDGPRGHVDCRAL